MSIEKQQGKDDEDMTPMHMTMFGIWYGGVGGQQGCPSQEGGPRLIQFKSMWWRPKATQVRVYLGLQDQSALNWSPKTHLDSVFDKEANPSGLTSKYLRNKQESSKQVSVQNLPRCYDTAFWSVGPCIVFGSIRGRVQGVMPKTL